MERTNGNETPLKEQGQERVSGENGGSAEGGRPFAPSPERRASGQCPEVKPLGRVQGDNACSGVQRVKPLAQ